MSSNLFNQFSRFLGSSESNVPQNNAGNFNLLALRISFLIYAIIVGLMLTFLYEDTSPSKSQQPRGKIFLNN